MSLRAFTMPKWGIEMAEGVITEWQVDEGQAFSKGDLLAAVETDKIVNEIEAEYDATCLRRIAEAGETYPVGALLAVMGPADAAADKIDAFVASFVPAETVDTQDADSVTETAPPSTAPISTADSGSYEPNTELAISPKALEAAAAGNADLSLIARGSGRDGRIQKQDVERLISGAASIGGKPVDNRFDPGDWQSVDATPVAQQMGAQRGLDPSAVKGSGKADRIRLRDLPADNGAKADRDNSFEPFSPVRRRIAQRMNESAAIPHFYLEISVDAGAIMGQRQRLAEAGSKVSVNDFLVLAAAISLQAVPEVNVHVSDEGVRRFGDSHIAIAVARDDGLITPVIRSAQDRDLAGIAAESRRLAGAAREGNLTSDDLSGGTFTVSNLGMFGIDRFTGLLNPPQAAILSVGATRRVAVEHDDSVAFEDRMTLTLGCDHRAIDGALGARFLTDLKSRLEDPASLAGGSSDAS